MMKTRLMAALCLFGGGVSVTGGVASAATSPITVTVTVPAGSGHGYINMLCGGVRVFADAAGAGPYTATAQAPDGTDTCDLRFGVEAANSTGFSYERDVAITDGVGTASFDYPSIPLIWNTLYTAGLGADANYEVYSTGTRTMPDGFELQVNSESDFYAPAGAPRTINIAGSALSFDATEAFNNDRHHGQLDVTGVSELTWVISGGIYVGNPTSNADDDGVVDAEESGSFFDGDGNNDGTADASQANVVSLVSEDGYGTFAVNSGIKIDTISVLEPYQMTSRAPTDWDAAYDSFDISLTGVTVGGSATMRVFNNVHGRSQNYQNYALYDHGTWSLLPIVLDSSHTFYDVTLVDGGAGDVDHTANGVIETVANYSLLTFTADGDGVSDGVENGAAHGGDGNNDGTPDREQNNVTSLPDVDGGYVTLAGPDGTSLVDVTAVDPAGLPTPPAGTTLPDGLFSFTVDGVTSGGSATVRVFTPTAASATGWAKYHDDAWSLLPPSSVAIDPAGEWIEITLVDGGIGDDDGVANGQIVDPGGVVVSSGVADNDAPVVSCAAAPAGWSKVDVSIACTAVDSGSGLADPADASFSLTTAVPVGSSTAAATTGSRSVCDVAGNCFMAGPFGGLKVDKLGPTVTITSPTGANVTRGSSLTAHFTCADAGSGPSTCVGTVANGAPISTSSTGAKSFTVTASDAVGNTSSRTVNYQVVAPNVAPVVRADLGVAGLEDVGFQSRTVRLTGSFSDADGAGPYTASVRWQSTGSFVPLTVSGSGFTGTTTYPSSGTRVVSVKVCDAQGACGTDTLTVRAGVTVQVVAVAQCVVDGGSRANPRYTARFGYNNSASYAIVVPTVAGSENTVSPSPALRGQPQVFLSGQRRNVFAVGFNSGSVSWRLNGKTVSISKSTKKC